MRPGEIVIALILVALGGLFFWRASLFDAAQQQLLRRLSNPPAAAVPPIAAPSKPANADQTLEDAALQLSRASVPQIRSSAIPLLSLLGGEKTEARLLEMVKDDPACRSSALQALRGMGSRKVSGIILDWLKNGSPAERQTAASVLPGQMTQEMLPDILKLLRNVPTGGTEYSGAQVRQYLYNALQQLGDRRACDALLAAMREETQEYTKQSAVSALAACASRREIALVGKALASLGPCAPNMSSSMHHALVQCLGNLRDPRATEYLLPLLTASSNEQLRRQVVQALVQLRDPLAAKTLCALDIQDQNLKRYVDDTLRNAAYPGIRVVDDKLVCVPDEEMKKLLEERTRQIAEIEKGLADDAVKAAGDKPQTTPAAVPAEADPAN